MFCFMTARRFAVALAVGVAALGLAGPAAAGEAVPFKGVLDGDVTVTGAPPFLQVDVEAAGKATQLGRFTVDIPHLVDVRFGTAAGAYTFTAANGDTVYAMFTGQATPI